MNWLNDVLENDLDPPATREWMESLKAVMDTDGPERAHHLLERMVELTRRTGGQLPINPTAASRVAVSPTATADWNITPRCMAPTPAALAANVTLMK